jgi:cell wall-associated NlpC family hydrolase
MTPREHVIAEALTWRGTPWHHAGRVKGAGVDCGMFPAEVYERCGVMPHIEPGPYAQDVMKHRGEERFLALVAAHAHPVETPRPGDLVLWRFGRCFSHAAIVVDWPLIIHSYIPAGGVELGDAQADADLARRLVVFFSPWGGE